MGGLTAAVECVMYRGLKQQRGCVCVGVFVCRNTHYSVSQDNSFEVYRNHSTYVEI